MKSTFVVVYRCGCQRVMEQRPASDDICADHLQGIDKIVEELNHDPDWFKRMPGFRFLDPEGEECIYLGWGKFPCGYPNAESSAVKADHELVACCHSPNRRWLILSIRGVDLTKCSEYVNDRL